VAEPTRDVHSVKEECLAVLVLMEAAGRTAPVHWPSVRAQALQTYRLCEAALFASASGLLGAWLERGLGALLAGQGAREEVWRETEDAGLGWVWGAGVRGMLDADAGGVERLAELLHRADPDAFEAVLAEARLGAAGRAPDAAARNALLLQARKGFIRVRAEGWRRRRRQRWQG
jgi:hypothetical protein